MDYEKKYKEALEVAQRFYNNSAAITKKGLEDIFPELKESEDEITRKELIDFVKSRLAGFSDCKRFTDWLEKQGKNNMGISEATKKKLEDNLNKALEKETPESFNKFLDEQGEQKQPKELTNSEFVEKCKGLSRLEQHILALVPTRPIDAIKVDARTIRHLVEQEQKPADKVEPKFKIGDKVHLINGSSPNYEDDCIVISDISNNTYYGNWEGGYFAIKDQDKYELVEQKPDWSEEDEAIYYGVIETEQYMLDVVNGIKKFNVGNISIKEECTRELNWLKSLKDRIQPQPKQEWSEDDEERLSDAIFFVREYQIPTRDKRLLNAAKEAEDWLKSLKPQNRWKPSDEQMDAVFHACNRMVGDRYHDAIVSVYEQLKKLRED